MINNNQVETLALHEEAIDISAFTEHQQEIDAIKIDANVDSEVNHSYVLGYN